MRIIILGAGQVGASLAQNLARENNDVFLIDQDEKRLHELQYRLDIQTVQGNAASPKILIDAGIEQADMLIAVTNCDEINMLACRIAYSLFRTPTKIARIRSRDYYHYPQLLTEDSIPIDVCISPEKLVTDHIVNLISYPGVSSVSEFAEGQVLLVTIKPLENGIMLGKTIRELQLFLEDIDARVVALLQHRTVITPVNSGRISLEDEVVFVASPAAIRKVLVALGRFTHPNRRIIIAGGGHIGLELAKQLEGQYRVKVIEQQLERASELASNLHKSTILQGDVADRDLLINENIEFTDVFCAVTNDDEANIMSSLLAKRLGARQVMALVNRNAYVDLIDDSPIDQAISPQMITIGSILTKLRRGNMVRVYRFQHSDVEAIELIIRGDKNTSQVVGRTIAELPLPADCLILSVVRGGQVLLAQGQLILATDDHLVLLLLQKRYINQLESLFQVNLSFVG